MTQPNVCQTSEALPREEHWDSGLHISSPVKCQTHQGHQTGSLNRLASPRSKVITLFFWNKINTCLWQW